MATTFTWFILTSLLSNKLLAISTQECKEADGLWCNSTKICLGKSLICDNYSDCANGEDEFNCDASYKGLVADKMCMNGGYWCRQSARCVPLLAHCDKKRDCRYGEDELTCHSTSKGHGRASNCSSPGDFWCENSRTCIAKMNRCDRFVDCYYGEDERFCSHGGGLGAGSLSESHESSEAIACRKDSKIWCQTSKVCLAYTKMCDRKVDCSNGEDEKSCVYGTAATTDVTYTRAIEITTQKYVLGAAAISAIAGLCGLLIVVLLTVVIHLCCCNKRHLKCKLCSLIQEEDCSSRVFVETAISGGASESSLQAAHGQFTSEPPLYCDLADCSGPPSQQAEEPPAYETACNSGSVDRVSTGL